MSLNWRKCNHVMYFFSLNSQNEVYQSPNKNKEVGTNWKYEFLLVNSSVHLSYRTNKYCCKFNCITKTKTGKIILQKYPNNAGHYCQRLTNNSTIILVWNISALCLWLPGCKVQIINKHSQIKIIPVWKIVYFEHQIGKPGAHNKTLSQVRLSEIVKT